MMNKKNATLVLIKATLTHILSTLSSSVVLFIQRLGYPFFMSKQQFCFHGTNYGHSNYDVLGDNIRNVFATFVFVLATWSFHISNFDFMLAPLDLVLATSATILTSSLAYQQLWLIYWQLTRIYISNFGSYTGNCNLDNSPFVSHQ